MKKKPVDVSLVREEAVAYRHITDAILPKHAAAVTTKPFLYTDFKKIADKAPFTLGEWARFLHISERTLHRYAKEASAFHGLQVERILHLKKLIITGQALLGKQGFAQWLQQPLFSLQAHRPEEFLLTHEGIQEVTDLLHRMQQGLPA